MTVIGPVLVPDLAARRRERDRWNEYATKMGAGTTSVPYALTADGLTEAEFWRIAESLEGDRARRR